MVQSNEHSNNYEIGEDECDGVNENWQVYKTIEWCPNDNTWTKFMNIDSNGFVYGNILRRVFRDLIFHFGMIFEAKIIAKNKKANKIQPEEKWTATTTTITTTTFIARLKETK